MNVNGRAGASFHQRYGTVRITGGTFINTAGGYCIALSDMTSQSITGGSFTGQKSGV